MSQDILHSFKLDQGDDARRRALLEAAEQLAKVGTWEWLPTEDRLIWSDGLYRIFGYEPGEMTPSAQALLRHTHPDDRDRVARRLQTMAEEGTLARVVYRIVPKQGGVRHVRATMAHSEQRDGRPYRLIGWLQDITEERRAQRVIAAHVGVAEALAEWDTEEGGAERLLGSLAEALDGAAGTLWVPDGEVLVPRTYWQAATVSLPRFRALTLDSRMPRGHGVPGTAWATGQPVVIGMGLTGMVSRRRDAAYTDGLRGCIAIPALVGQEVLAVVDVATREEPEHTDALCRSLTGIGHEIGQFFARRRGELATPPLTPRELEVLRLSALGMSARRVAEELEVSPATVRTHLENIYAKLGASDKASAVATALRRGLMA